MIIRNYFITKNNISRVIPERFERLAGAVIELSEELDVLKPAGVNIRTQYINRHVEGVPADKYENENNHSENPGTCHGTHLVYYLSYNARGKSKCKQSRI